MLGAQLHELRVEYDVGTCAPGLGRSVKQDNRQGRH
jgi:hypothetical protein